MTFYQILGALGARNEQHARETWRAEALRRTPKFPETEDKFVAGNRTSAKDQLALMKFWSAVAERKKKG